MSVAGRRTPRTGTRPGSMSNRLASHLPAMATGTMGKAQESATAVATAVGMRKSSLDGASVCETMRIRDQMGSEEADLNPLSVADLCEVVREDAAENEN